jgi:hypothetical protein
MATGKQYWFKFLDASKMVIIEKTIEKMAIDLDIETSVLRAILFEIIATDPEINAKVMEKAKELREKYRQL